MSHLDSQPLRKGHVAGCGFFIAVEVTNVAVPGI